MPAATTLDRLTQTQDKVIETVESFQQPVVEAVRKAVDLVEDRLPELPTERLTAQLPTAREVVDNQFAFAARLLEATHQLTLAVLDAVEPVTDKVVRATPPSKARGTKKTTAEAA
jgi:hypothetical protein